jgi:hypothetical protein
MDSDELYDRQVRSALRHRPISTGDAVAMTDQDQPQPRIQRASRMRNTTTDETRQTLGPHKDTTETYQSTPSQSGTKIQPKVSEEKKRGFPVFRLFRSLPQRARMLSIFVASIIVTLLVVILYQQVANLVTITWDDLHYGRPRTFQADAFVGHEKGNVPSHFIALNLKGHIEIIELPGGDAAHIYQYSGPQLVGPNADLVSPSLQFVNASLPHYKDMILRAGDIQVNFRNVPQHDPPFEIVA